MQPENVPWTDKFRPRKLSDILSHDMTVETLKKCIANKYIPHLLFYGPPGTGKTSTIAACARDLYGDTYDMMVLEINAAEERGIEMVRTKIKPFVSTKINFFEETVPFKLVILDEADYMTPDAQAMLRLVIEEFTRNARFCLICNYNKNINPAIVSRCTLFRFPPLKAQDMKKKILDIAENTGIAITDSGCDSLIKLSKGDMRKLLNILQTVCIGNNQKITDKTVYRCVGYPSDKEMQSFFRTMVGTKSFEKKYKKIKATITKNSLSVQNILSELAAITFNMLSDNLISDKEASEIFYHLGQIEINLTLGPNEFNQLGAIIGVFTLFKSANLDGSKN